MFWVFSSILISGLKNVFKSNKQINRQDGALGGFVSFVAPLTALGLILTFRNEIDNLFSTKTLNILLWLNILAKYYFHIHNITYYTFITHIHKIYCMPITATTTTTTVTPVTAFSKFRMIFLSNKVLLISWNIRGC